MAGSVAAQRRHAHVRPLTVLVLLAVLLVPSVLLSACSKSEKAKKSSTTTTSKPIPKPGTPENPIAFAYRITGDPGTNVTVQSTLQGQGVSPEPMTQVWTVSEKPVAMMLPTGAESGTIRLEVTEGASATLEFVKGHAVDPADAQAGVKATETISSITASLGQPAELTFP